MGGAQQYPSAPVRMATGIASLHPSGKNRLPLSPRHCERSEAIHPSIRAELWIASLRSQ